MAERFALYRRFEPALRSSTSSHDFILGNDRGISVLYIPFEHVNRSARLVLVGISPGPKQLRCAHLCAAALLARSTPPEELLAAVKKSCAFAGMRDQINEMLDHFEVPSLINARSASALWNSDFTYFEATSIIPNAAFRNGKPFAGPFKDVLRSPLLKNQFDEHFIPAIRSLSKESLYVAMGPVVSEALEWCATHGVVSPNQIIGYFPHASGASGSQGDYFLGKKSLADLKPLDPVRHRAKNLDAARDRIIRNITALRGH